MGLYHNPVLLKESVDGLAVRSDGVYVDVTYGGGGHSKEILSRLGAGGRLLAFDRDRDAGSQLPDDARVTLIHHNYRFLKNYLRYHKALPVDGILADLGVSSHQIDEAERGFSTRYDGALDLRMDRKRGRSAAELVNTAPEEELARIFKEYGELEHSRRIAAALVAARDRKEIQGTADLKEAVRQFTTAGQEHKFYARVFQALRIEVNRELESLEQMLVQSLQVLRPGGRLAVISYHSLEDRMVKNFMKTGNAGGIEDKDPIYGNVSTPLRVITKKAVCATEEEISQNGRARSARLRIAEKN
jgi:16S rRNA (cytosine1402-N4)-methyltransferase